MTSLELDSSPPLKDAASVVRAVASGVSSDGITWKDALAGSDQRGFAPFLLFAFVLLLLPIDAVLPPIAGVTMIVCGLGLAVGAAAPWLPGFLAQRRISRAGLERLAIAPLPNLIPALAVLALAMGLLQRDGLVTLIGVAVGVGWIAFLGAMAAGVAAHATYASGWAQDNAPALVTLLQHGAPPPHP